MGQVGGWPGGGWVAGQLTIQIIMPLCGPNLQDKTYQIFSAAKISRLCRAWQYKTSLASKGQMSMEIVDDMLEKVNKSLMVKSIIRDEVKKLDGWMVAMDSMGTVLGMTWSQAGNICEEISAEQEVQNIILRMTLTT